MKVLQIGPGIETSRGGMATVIGEIQGDRSLREQFHLDSFSSYADGGRLRSMGYSAWALLKFLLTGKASAYDVYHIHVASWTSTWRKALYAAILRARHKKIILHIHGGQYLDFYRGLSSGGQKRVRHFLQSADLVLALSEEWKSGLESALGLSNCVVLRNGVDTERLSPAVTDPGANPCAFLSLARMTEEKGTYDLLEAARIAAGQVPGLKLYLAGDGEIETVKRLVSEKNLSGTVEVVGWADFDKKLELLKNVSTVVLPSYHEALPMSILEAMACGKAVISTTVGAIPEAVKEENGILIPPGEIRALARAMVALSTDSGRLRAYSAANLRRIREHYSMENMHSRLASFYEYVYRDVGKQK